MHVSFTLPNRGVLFGVTTVDEMLDLAHEADETGLFQAVWVGDSLLGKPRLESISLLSALAARTRQVRLGPACMASFPLRDPVLLAYQWASLDLMAQGRTILVACTGIVEQPGAQVESALYGLEAKDRVQRLIEWIEILRRLWTEDEVAFEGRQYRFSGVSVAPRPAAQPPPIWIASNATGSRDLVVRTLRRAAVHADGWQTSTYSRQELAWRIPELLRHVAEAGKDPATYPVSIYHNININEDRQAALDESQRFLETYYTPTKFPIPVVEQWVAHGSPAECVEHLAGLRDLGATEVCLRLTSFDQRGQFRRLVTEVIPQLLAASTSGAG
jgi:alkanesulfonate monooxygenase SsuD/methylene tetrahydromethanopterin reductase-like flavin-dependent oxidoreductase (luciferase family)